MVRRIGEAVHARHNQQYEREVQEARDGNDDQHFVGCVAHADRGGVERDVGLRAGRSGGRRRRRRRRRVVAAVMPDLGCGIGGHDVRPQARRRYLVVSPVVPDGAPVVVTTGAVDVVHRFA